MEREKATERWDLPHAFDPPEEVVKGAGDPCRCGRQRGHELHKASAERASSQSESTIEREIGS